MSHIQISSLRKKEIYVNEIEFRGKQQIHLFGFMHHCGKFVETEYIINRKDLQTLLSNNGKKGLEILWGIETLFMLPHQSPATLNLIALFGTTQLFEAQEIKLDAPARAIEPGEPLNLERPELLFIDAIIPQKKAHKN